MFLAFMIVNQHASRSAGFFLFLLDSEPAGEFP
jgi:hypothetical protein